LCPARSRAAGRRPIARLMDVGRPPPFVKLMEKNALIAWCSAPARRAGLASRMPEIQRLRPKSFARGRPVAYLVLAAEAGPCSYAGPSVSGLASASGFQGAALYDRSRSGYCFGSNLGDNVGGGPAEVGPFLGTSTCLMIGGPAPEPHTDRRPRYRSGCLVCLVTRVTVPGGLAWLPIGLGRRGAPRLTPDPASLGIRSEPRIIPHANSLQVRSLAGVSLLSALWVTP
jgi:hypothetical protein